MIKRWIKTAPALLLAVLLCVCAPALETGEACAFLQTERDAYVEYLLSLSLSNGAIALYRPTVAQYPSSAPEALDGVPAETYLRWRSAKLEPSAATAAARGLLTAGDAGRDAAEGYIEWYFSHLNTADEDAYGIDGTVYDTYFFIEDGDSPRLLEITGRALFAAEYGDEASNPHAYASSDASSAAFLSLLRAYVGRYGGLGRFSDRLTEIDRIAGAMLATYDEALGLTACKGADSDRLLVNNCIVYRGCIDAAWLYRVLPDCAEKAAEMDGYASRLREGIETHLWDATAGRYRTAVSASGAPTADAGTSDVFAQLYPLLCGLPEAEGERGQALYAAFRADGLDDWFAQTAGADTGAALGLAVLKVGDAESARAFIAALRDRYAAAGYPYPFSAADAGQALLTIDGLLALCPPAEESAAPSSEAASDAEEPADGSALPAVLAAAGFAALVAGSFLLYSRRKKKTP